jgi:hypothetical protein
VTEIFGTLIISARRAAAAVEQKRQREDDLWRIVAAAGDRIY